MDHPVVIPPVIVTIGLSHLYFARKLTNANWTDEPEQWFIPPHFQTFRSNAASMKVAETRE